MKAILVDLSGIKKIDINGLDDMQKAVGGFIETAFDFENGDTAYCNEEGLLSEPEFFTYIKGAHQPFAGPILIVGTTKSGGTKAPVSTVEDVKKQVTTNKRIVHFKGE